MPPFEYAKHIHFSFAAENNNNNNNQLNCLLRAFRFHFCFTKLNIIWSKRTLSQTHRIVQQSVWYFTVCAPSRIYMHLSFTIKCSQFKLVKQFYGIIGKSIDWIYDIQPPWKAEIPKSNPLKFATGFLWIGLANSHSVREFWAGERLVVRIAFI